ncbi:MAG: PHP-associated domain-containing protein [Candidatus Micrarchaeota archaeon]
MKLDFHVHTNHSIDTLIRPRDLVAKSKRLGIIPAIADHDTTSGHAEMRSLGAPFIPGQEVTTDKGHLIGLYLSEEVPKGAAFLEAIDKIKEQGALAYLPHMYDRGRAKARPSDDEASKADIIEIFNARCMKEEYNEKAMAFAKEHNKPMGTGTDSHFLFEFGTTYTELPDFDIENPKALLKALKAAKFITKRAPIYVRGTTITVKHCKRVLRRFGIRP